MSYYDKDASLISRVFIKGRKSDILGLQGVGGA